MESIRTDITTCSEIDVATLTQFLSNLGLSYYEEQFEKEKLDLDSLKMCSEEDLKQIGVPLGPRKKILKYLADIQFKKSNSPANLLEIASNVDETQTQSKSVMFLVPQDMEPGKHAAGAGQPVVTYPQLDFPVLNFYAFGSPIALFLIVRGCESLGTNFKFNTCSGFFNIFHPFDPFAYRLEQLIMGPCFTNKPVLIPHHKGRKRLHLEIKENLARVGVDLRKKISEMVKSTWDSMYQFAMSHRNDMDSSQLDQTVQNMAEEYTENVDESMTDDDSSVADATDTVQIGELNAGRRIDYMLQESPLESFNDYLFALGSHACYWRSEDTVLMVLKESYMPKGILAMKPGAAVAPASPPISHGHGHEHAHAPAPPPSEPSLMGGASFNVWSPRPPQKPYSASSSMDMPSKPLEPTPSLLPPPPTATVPGMTPSFPPPKQNSLPMTQVETKSFPAPTPLPNFFQPMQSNNNATAEFLAPPAQNKPLLPPPKAGFVPIKK